MNTDGEILRGKQNGGYTVSIEDYEWDENKNKINQEKHKISFEFAIEIFNLPVLTKIDTRDYGTEIRQLSIGMIEDNLYLLVVWTKRGEKKRIISARKANRNERKIYYEYIQRRTN